MDQFVWLDGALVPWDQANIHVMTHTLHYGSGAFEGIRCYKTDKGPAIFKLSEHIDRLLTSFSCFGVAVPWSQQILEQAVIDTVKANRLNDCYIRPIIFFGSESILISPKSLSVHCAIITIPMVKYLGNNGITVGISPIKRMSPYAVPIHSKINGFYVNSILAFHEIKQRGFDEALLLDDHGNIAEGSVANIFFVLNGVLKTPPSQFILPGITRTTVFEIAKSLGITVEETELHVEDIEHATEAFFTGTASEVTPIKAIEKKEFHIPGSITQRIQEEYQNIVTGKNKSFISCLTFIPS